MENVYVTIITSAVSAITGGFIFLQNRKIEKVQKAEIDKLKEDFKRQSELIGNVKNILDIYDVDKFRKHQQLTIEAKDIEHKLFVEKIEKELKDVDVLKFELIKFCLGALKGLGEEKQTELIDLYFPKNKKEFIMYIKKARI